MPTRPPSPCGEDANRRKIEETLELECPIHGRQKEEESVAAAVRRRFGVRARPSPSPPRGGPGLLALLVLLPTAMTYINGRATKLREQRPSIYGIIVKEDSIKAASRAKAILPEAEAKADRRLGESIAPTLVQYEMTSAGTGRCRR